MSEQHQVREVVHELRNYFSAIVTAANALQKSDFDQELGPEMIEIIKNNVDRANTAIGTLVESASSPSDRAAGSQGG